MKDKSDKQEFKAKKQDLLRCENYMYRRKKSAKLDKVLNSLKNTHFSSRLSTLVTRMIWQCDILSRHRINIFYDKANY